MSLAALCAVGKQNPRSHWPRQWAIGRMTFPTHLTTFGQPSSLENQLGGLRNRHEIANNLGVGEGDRPTGIDLLGE